jgi:hypothetical protein
VCHEMNERKQKARKDGRKNWKERKKKLERKV